MPTSFRDHALAPPGSPTADALRERALFMASLGLTDADMQLPPEDVQGSARDAAAAAPPPPPRQGRRAYSSASSASSMRAAGVTRRRHAEPITPAELQAAGIAEYHPPRHSTPDDIRKSGNAAFGAGDFVSAVSIYTAAIEEVSDSATLYSNRAAAWLQTDLPQGPRMALRDAERAELLDPQWFKPAARRGDALFKLCRFREASAAYEASLRLDPSQSCVRDSLQECEAAMRAEDDYRMAEPLPAPAAHSRSFTDETALGSLDYDYAAAVRDASPAAETAPSGRLVNLVNDYQRDCVKAGRTCGSEYRRRELERFRDGGVAAQPPSPPSRSGSNAMLRESPRTPDAEGPLDTFSSASAKSYRDSMLQAYRSKKLGAAAGFEPLGC
eukprot:TRINITY_DN1913_c1_g1_i1.p1 TRINITY_DN1913_c1_g1~~TRINITY_DN1913_c1_g1_i1.p1  ORF type:complete len:400 (+),score=102.41 TRINITY_DN1913_c1_g1_i1:46-1200(+)